MAAAGRDKDGTLKAREDMRVGGKALGGKWNSLG